MKTILGVKIDDISMPQAVETVSSWLEARDGKAHYIVTPGPEFLVTASTDAEFKKILNQADLSISDGVSLHLAGVKHIVPGVDLMLALCQEAAKKGWTIGLLGGEEGIAAKTWEQLQKDFKGLKINFALDGSKADHLIGQVYSKNGPPSSMSADVLFVNLGHPKQEKLINTILNRRTAICNFRVAMGVGGSFDFVSGNIHRSPKLVQLVSLEWLFRIFAEKPEKRLQRIQRIFRATLIFPFLLLKEKIAKPVI